MSDIVREGDYVILYHSPNLRFLTKVEKGRRLDTIKGSIILDYVIGLEYGSKVKTSLGYEFVVTKPRIEDVMFELYKRPTQVIYPKDAAYIILKTGIGPGSIVIEAGVGSGFMTTFLAYYVRPNGKVYGYEKRPEFLEIAKKNLEKTGLLNWVELKLRDVVEQGFDLPDNYVDAVVLDLGYPWEMLSEIYRVLKHGGSAAIYLPSILQVYKMLDRLKQFNKFIDIEVVEILLRNWKIIPEELRPETWMIAHTGFIIFMRKP